jgi:hypothetical protein
VDIPSIPTDNLYKFLAIGGLVAWIGGAYLNYLSSSNSIHQKATVALEDVEASFNRQLLAQSSKIFDLDLKIAQSDYEGDEAKLKAFLEAHKQSGAPLSDQDQQTLEQLLSQVRKDNSEFLALGPKLLDLAQQQAKASSAETKAKFDALEEEWTHGAANTFFWISTAFQTLGISSCIWGFFWWYWRVQRYQDQLLKNEAAQIAPSDTSFPV